MIPQASGRLAGLVALILMLALAPLAAQAQDDSTGAPVAEGQGAAQTAEPAPEAQTPQAVAPAVPSPPATPAPPTTIITSLGETLDLAVWEALAARAERAVVNTAISTNGLEILRGQLAGWREDFLGAQNANASRIVTLREQIAALGPVPAEGETEAAEIAARRAELNAQLVTLQAPGRAADEAYRRADGLIREIDRALRERQTNELLRLLPSPLNPANWAEGFGSLTTAISGVAREATVRWSLPTARAQLLDNLPLILLLLLAAAGLLLRSRALVEAGVGRLVARGSARAARVSQTVLSLGQIAVPALGAVLLAQAMKLSGMMGILGTMLADALPVAGLTAFAAYWLGGRIFLREAAFPGLELAPERRGEGRFLATLIGVLLAAQMLYMALMAGQPQSDAARSVLDFPFLVVGGFVLWRLGRLLRLAAKAEKESEDSGSVRARILTLLGRGAQAIGLIGPALAAVGYGAAAGAMVWPAATTLGLLGVILILQALVVDSYALIIRSEDEAGKALAPVLIGFALVLAALPVLALIWGARLSDLTEMWTRLREGFQIGGTRISPTDFLLFAVVFTVGYTVTRLFQGTLKGAVLPRTKLDQGARNAVVSGIGYIGIFLAALIAINTAGLDLSGLAIVAGALSVGIGFGLQNIVSNFVSGIILLIERPVSEGDWIEVGGVQGVVKSISVRSTRIQTFDRTDVIVPNSDLVAGRVTNWTRYNLTGRLIVPVGVAYGSDTRKVERVLREIAEAQPLAVLNPPPMVVFVGFGADSLNFEMRIILRDVNFSLSVRSEVNHQIAERFAREGIEVPFAQREVTLTNGPEIIRAFRGETAPEAEEKTGLMKGPHQMRPDHLPGEGLDSGDDEGAGETTR
jgi:small-conductance mechanosensitive channel